jgi:hypothetical protein
MASDPQMQTITKMHQQILGNVSQVQARTSRILQEQERDLLRAFRARLFDVQTELEKEKNKTDDGASAWIEKSRQLEAEVDWAKEMADRLDRVNQSLGRENQRLKTQFKTQEHDREYLVKELVAVKKDNARLRQEYDKQKTEVQMLRGAGEDGDGTLPPMHASSSGGGMHQGGGSGGMGGMHSATPEADNRYKEIVKRLKRLLEVERRNLRQVIVTHRVLERASTRLHNDATCRCCMHCARLCHCAWRHCLPRHRRAIAAPSLTRRSPPRRHNAAGALPIRERPAATHRARAVPEAVHRRRARPGQCKGDVC